MMSGGKLRGQHVKRRKVMASGKINGRAPRSDIVVVGDDKPILLINGKSVTAAPAQVVLLACLCSEFRARGPL